MTDEPVWVVVAETGTRGGEGLAGVAWVPAEDRDTAIAIYQGIVEKGRPFVTVYFVEYYPTIEYSIDPKVREKITEEIGRELWEFLPDDRPDA